MNYTHLQAAVDQLKKIDAHYLLVQRNELQGRYRFKPSETPSDIRSISKTVLAMFLGVMNYQFPEEIHSETYIFPTINPVIQLTNPANLPFLKKIQIKHLLTHQIGYEKVLLMRGDIRDKDPREFVNYLVNEPIVHEPGSHYLYSNASFYLLSVFLQEFLQKDLAEVINEQLFAPLGIQQPIWEKYGNYLAGATRLWLYPEELLKLGQLLLHKGTLGQQTFFTEEWFDLLVTPSTKTPHVDTPGQLFRRYEYAHGLWLPKEKNFFFAHGTDGQIMCLVPKQKAVLIIQANHPELTPVEQVMNDLLMAL